MDAQINESPNGESQGIGRMRADVKAQWTAALRSGEYRQGSGTLHNHANNSFCCLGVLCALAVKAGVTTRSEKPDVHGYSYGPGEEVTYLPHVVMEWAGLDSFTPKADGKELAILNDSGKTFAEIADIIDRDL